ncbi:MAG: M48 family metalloprotease [Pseudomonadota bacterium]
MFRFLLPLMLLAGCATPDFAAPPLDGAVVQAEREAAIREAMDTALERRARVYDLSWPVLTESVELCPDVRPSIGVVLADRKMLARLAGGLREEDLAEIGVPDHLIIAHTHAGSPAALKGVMSGARLLKVQGEEVEDPEAAAKKIREQTEEEKPVTLTISFADSQQEVEITPVDRCDYAVKISTSQAINAHAYSGDIVILTGAIRALDDESLRYLIAHEAAHLIAGHRPKYVRNSIVSGAVLVGPFIYGAGMLADRMAGFGDEPPDIAYTTRAVRFLLPWAEEFEAEADYLGLYLFARAGGDLEQARGIFDVFSRESPSSIYTRATHPLTPERLSRLLASVREIKHKQRSGEELLPNRVSK